jgi:hypothetical protein
MARGPSSRLAVLKVEGADVLLFGMVHVKRQEDVRVGGIRNEDVRGCMNDCRSEYWRLAR